MGFFFWCIVLLATVFACIELHRWVHHGKGSTDETKSHRRLLEEVRRHGEQEEGR